MNKFLISTALALALITPAFAQSSGRMSNFFGGVMPGAVNTPPRITGSQCQSNPRPAWCRTQQSPQTKRKLK
jgi:hypothetical protein